MLGMTALATRTLSKLVIMTWDSGGCGESGAPVAPLVVMPSKLVLGLILVRSVSTAKASHVIYWLAVIRFPGLNGNKGLKFSDDILIAYIFLNPINIKS